MKNTLKIIGFILSVSVFALILVMSALAVEFSANNVLNGSCDEVYWEIVPNDEGKYTMNILGSGIFRNLDSNGNNIGYSNPDACAWEQYRLDITKVIIGDGIYSLASGSFIHHKALHTIEFGASLSRIEAAAMEGCDELRTIYRKGNTPQVGTFDLRGISYLGGYVFDGCYHVEKIIFPTEGQYELLPEFLKSNSALKELYIPAACTNIQDGAFKYCSVKNIYFEGNTNVSVNAFEGCPDGLTISAHEGTSPHKYVLDHPDMKYQAPYTVSVYSENENIANIAAIKGFYIDCIVDSDATYILFADEARTKLISEVPVMGDMSINGVKLFDFLGFMVRVADYNGLRSIYQYDSTALRSLENYTIKEMGVLGAKYYGIDPVLDLDFHHGDKKIIWENGELIGKLIEMPKNGVYTFANVAVGYEDENGNLIGSNVASEIMTRAYVIITSNKTGEETVFYSSQNKKDLTAACKATKEAGEGILSTEQTAFLDDLIALKAAPDYIYSKDEAMEHLVRMYDAPDYILSGQHIYYSGPTAIKDTLNETYAHAKELPAVLSYDVSEGYRGYKESANKDEIVNGLVDQFAEYAKQGGLITICAHMTNPVNPSEGYNGTLTLDQWDDLFEEGTDVNTAFMTELSAIADFMQLLEDRGITIFWRPYHETNGNYFWFCGSSVPKKIEKKWSWSDFEYVDTEVDVSVDYFNRLWQYTYEYLETKRGLENLWWMYSPNFAIDGNEDGNQDVMKYYPGDSFVDVMGLDWYNNNDNVDLINNSSYKTILPRLAGKYTGSSKFPLTNKQMPVVYGEYGPNIGLRNRNPDNPELAYTGEDALKDIKAVRDYGYNMGWIVFWSSYLDAPYISLYSMYKADVFMADDFVYTLGESRATLLDAHYSK